MNIAAGITSLDPAFANKQENIWVISQIYNGLVSQDSQLTIQSCIAKGWDISPDGKTYTFHLRTNVSFHQSGVFKTSKRKVIASDFIYSIKRISDVNVASPGAWLLADKLDTVSKGNGLVAINDSTLQIKILRPCPSLLQILAMPYFFVVPHEAVEFYGKEFRIHPVGTGPFKLRYFYEKEGLVLEKNQNYFEFENGKRLPCMEGISIHFLPNKQNELLSFLAGKFDIVTSIDKSFKNFLIDKSGKLNPEYRDKFTLIKNPFLNTEYLGFYVDSLKQKSIISRKEFRKAVELSIDKERMMKYLRSNIGQAALNGFVPPSLMPELPFTEKADKEKAKKLLTEINYKGEEISLYTTSQYLDLAVFIQKELKQVGINLTLETVLPAKLSQMKSSGEAAFFRASWIADYPDAENFLSVFYSKNFTPNGPNYFHFKNEAFDKLFEAASLENNPGIRSTQILQMVKIIQENAPVIVLYYDEIVRLVSKRVHGLPNNPLNSLDLKRVKLN